MLKGLSSIPENHFETKRMNPQLRLPSVCFLYSEKDEKIKDEIAYYFKSLKSERLLSKIRYHLLEHQSANWWVKSVRKWDMFVLLVSIHLVTNDSYKQFLSFLKREHKLKRIAVLPILMGEAGIKLERFKKLQVFPINQKALQSGFWNTKDNFYFAVLEQIIPVIKEFTEIKTDHYNLWSNTKEVNDLKAYQFFLEEYPYSRHAEEARKIALELEEKQLIDSLEMAENISDYYEYLVNTPLELKRQEVVSKIHEIETSEDLIWEELKEYGQLEELLEYRMKYPKGKYQVEVAKKIKDKLSERKMVEYVFNHSTNVNLLKKLAINNLYRSELLSLESFLDYTDFLDNWWEEILEPWKFLQIFPAPIITVFLLIQLVALFMPYLLLKAGLLLLMGYSLYKLFKGWHFQYADRIYLQKAKKHLIDLRILLKICFIIKDEHSKKQITQLLNQLDEQTAKIEKKELKDYLKQKKRIIEFDFDVLLPKRQTIASPTSVDLMSKGNPD